MSALIREPNSKPVGQFVTPYKGTWRSVAANMLQPDQLYESLNVFIREGKLRDRPGLDLLVPTDLQNPVIGGSLVVTPTKKILLAFTYIALYRLEVDDVDWSIDTVSSIAEGDNSTLSLTFLETASTYVAIVANGETSLKRWIDGEGLAPIVATEGTVPIASSVCTAASRIVCLVDNHTIVWSDTLTYTAWSPLSYSKKPAETNDAGICVKALSSHDFAVYKERSIYVARAQAAADGAAFAIQLTQIVEGPASSRAVVDVNGYHMYMTPNGRVAIFDGTSYVQWIADGLWVFLQNDIDPAWSSKILGVFDYRLHTVTFYYPRRGDNGVVKGMLLINVPLDGSGLTDYACFIGASNLHVTHGYEMRFHRATNRAIVFCSYIGQDLSFICSEDENFDHEAPFDCVMQTSLLPMPDMKHNQVSAEIFIERGDGNGSVDVSLVTSDALETASGTVQDIPSETLNLEFNPVREYVGFNRPTRFVGLRLTWRSDSTVRYAGAVIYGREVS